MHGLADVLGSLEESGHLVKTVYEHERPDLGELVGNGVEQVEGEPRERGHRSRDVSHHHDLRFGRSGMPELRLCWYPAVAQRMTHSAPEVERAAAPVLTFTG